MNLKFKTLIVATTALAFTSVEAMAVEWKVSLWGKRRAFTEHVEHLAKSVEEKTKGAFKIKLFYGGALSKSKANLDGISYGAFQMAQFCAGYHRDKNPTITVLELPFLGVSTLEEEIAVSRAVYAHPAVQKDLARWKAKLLMPSPMPQYNVAGVGKAPEKVADFKGIRIRATGGIGNAFKAVGAVPTSMTASEIYNAMDSGVVSAVAFAEHAHISYRTIDISKWWTSNLNPGTVNCPVVVNTDAFNALSDEHKKALTDSIEPALAHYLKNYKVIQDEKFSAVLKDKNIKKVTFSDEDIASFKEKAAGPARDAWLKTMEKRGIPGKELYDLVITTLKKK
ncbi:MAG: C4-dicarboxylate TRAP transporter substrate-binding protein [Methyloligellaceae bacterium]